MADIIFDGDFTTATICGPEIPSAPIAGVETEYVIRQRFCQKFESYTPTAIGTVHPTRGTYYLVAEENKSFAQGGIMIWDRVYAQVPAQHNEYTTTNYQFIGFYGLFGVNTTTVTGRSRFNKTIVARVQHDYYRTGVAPYTNVSDIPILEAQKYYFGADENLVTDFLADAPPFSTATTPSRTDYEALVSGASSIVAQDSTIERWMGKIYYRRTIYIFAK